MIRRGKVMEMQSQEDKDHEDEKVGMSNRNEEATGRQKEERGALLADGCRVVWQQIGDWE